MRLMTQSCMKRQTEDSRVMIRVICNSKLLLHKSARLPIRDSNSSTQGSFCSDENECLLNNGHGPCQDTCTNTNGGYICSCEGLRGTQLASDNHTCAERKGCSVGNGGCSHQCIDSYNQVNQPSVARGGNRSKQD